jgi:hypothetical protein
MKLAAHIVVGPSSLLGQGWRALLLSLVLVLAVATVAAAKARSEARQKPPLSWVRSCRMLDAKTQELLDKTLVGRKPSFVRGQLGEPDRVCVANGCQQLCYRYGCGLVRVCIRQERANAVLVDLWPADRRGFR